MTPAEVFAESLPAKPYCTDDFALGLRIRLREIARRYRYIQPNAPWDLRWMVYDIDRPGAGSDWVGENIPAPNLVVTSRESGHAHYLYGLVTPVFQQASAKLGPVRFAAAVDIGLTRLLDADPGYSKLITKNPGHQSFVTTEANPELWDLSGLADWLILPDYRDGRRELPAEGLGRNVTMFDRTRRWAYRERRRPQAWLGYDFWLDGVTAKARAVNASFDHPLPESEVKATAKSIAKWTWANMSIAGFRQWGDRRRARSIQTRKAKAAERIQLVQAIKAANPGWSTRRIAAETGISQSAVDRALRAII